MAQDVFVTGLGIITGIGKNVEETLNALKSLHSGVGPISHLKTVHDHLPCSEVPFPIRN